MVYVCPSKVVRMRTRYGLCGQDKRSVRARQSLGAPLGNNSCTRILYLRAMGDMREHYGTV